VLRGHSGACANCYTTLSRRIADCCDADTWINSTVVRKIRLPTYFHRQLANCVSEALKISRTNKEKGREKLHSSINSTINGVELPSCSDEIDLDFVKSACFAVIPSAYTALYNRRLEGVTWLPFGGHGTYLTPERRDPNEQIRVKEFVGDTKYYFTFAEKTDEKVDKRSCFHCKQTGHLRAECPHSSLQGDALTAMRLRLEEERCSTEILGNRHQAQASAPAPDESSTVHVFSREALLAIPSPVAGTPDSRDSALNEALSEGETWVASFVDYVSSFVPGSLDEAPLRALDSPDISEADETPVEPETAGPALQPFAMGPLGVVPSDTAAHFDPSEGHRAVAQELSAYSADQVQQIFANIRAQRGEQLYSPHDPAWLSSLPAPPGLPAPIARPLPQALPQQQQVFLPSWDGLGLNAADMPAMHPPAGSSCGHWQPNGFHDYFWQEQPAPGPAGRQHADSFPLLDSDTDPNPDAFLPTSHPTDQLVHMLQLSSDPRFTGVGSSASPAEGRPIAAPQQPYWRAAR